MMIGGDTMPTGAACVWTLPGDSVVGSESAVMIPQKNELRQVR
jgi:hypothetical protein